MIRYRSMNKPNPCVYHWSQITSVCARVQEPCFDLWHRWRELCFRFCYCCCVAHRQNEWQWNDSVPNCGSLWFCAFVILVWTAFGLQINTYHFQWNYLNAMNNAFFISWGRDSWQNRIDLLATYRLRFTNCRIDECQYCFNRNRLCKKRLAPTSVQLFPKLLCCCSYCCVYFKWIPTIQIDVVNKKIEEQQQTVLSPLKLIRERKWKKELTDNNFQLWQLLIRDRGIKYLRKSQNPHLIWMKGTSLTNASSYLSIEWTTRKKNVEWHSAFFSLTITMILKDLDIANFAFFNFFPSSLKMCEWKWIANENN